MTKVFIEDQDEVMSILSRLTSTEESPEYFRETLIDLESKIEWEKYLFELNDQHDEGTGLRRLPIPPVDKIIQIALNSDQMDEVEGAAACLLDYDKEGSFREVLINELEDVIDTISLEKFEILYFRAELYESLNYRNYIGKSMAEINSDHDYFVSLANRVTELHEKIKGREQSLR